VRRRHVLEAGVALAATALWPQTSGFAQTGSSLVRAPKRALVIGNGRYKHSPLKNPVNDANGVAEALRAVGFEVTLGLEMSRESMRGAIEAYVASLARAKAVGLFYFAGHGVQLAWRNYLLPLDAEIMNVEQLRERAIDVNSLIDGLRKAANPMNIIVLDACRDNPFGGHAQSEQRGLSQLDAPPTTLLAYATAPGNTAADGEGDNGLYTEHFLREIKVPETRVEDVFKRVRLAVRRRSNGQQIPWESTSLEEDFWFIPPAQVRRLAEAEAEREYQQELAVWERIRKAQEPGPFEDYLLRHPSGRFSELAQLNLDRLLAKQGEKAVEIVAAPQNPYSKGSGRANTAYKIGDSYIYRITHMVSGQEERPFRYVITDITDTEIIFNNGSESADLLGNLLQTAAGPRRGPNQIVPLEFAVGKRWSTRFDTTDASGRSSVVSLDLSITTREVIIVPAGSFNCFRVEGTGWAQSANARVKWDLKRWYAPDRLRNYAKAEILIAHPQGKVVSARRSELTSFHES